MESCGSSTSVITVVETPSDRPKSIALGFKSQDGNEVYFKFKENKKMFYVLKEYCNTRYLQMEYVVFLYNGARVAANRTAFELGMESGDYIDVMEHQHGGGH